MSFKKTDPNLSFADVALFNSLQHNRAIKRMQQISAVVDWPRIDRILMRNYPVGKSNEGIAVDARLVQSASHPISKEKLEEEKKKRDTPEGKLNKNGNLLKFSRDLESDWTVKNDTPHYGLKEHASVDTRFGFVLATEMTPASFHDSPYLPLCVAGSCHTQNPIKKAYIDKGYFGKDNRDFLHM